MIKLRLVIRPIDYVIYHDELRLRGACLLVAARSISSDEGRPLGDDGSSLLAHNFEQRLHQLLAEIETQDGNSMLSQ